MNVWQRPAIAALVFWVLFGSAAAQVEVTGVDRGLAGDVAGVKGEDIIIAWSRADSGLMESIVWPFDLLLAEELGSLRQEAMLHLLRAGQELTLSVPAGRWGIRSTPATGIDEERRASLAALESAQITDDLSLLPKLTSLDGSADWHAAIAWQSGDILAEQQMWDRAREFWQYSQTLTTNNDQRSLLDIRLARAAFGLRDIDLADELANKGLEHWTAKNAAMHVLRSHNLLGFNAFERRDLETAESHFELAVELVTDIRPLDPAAISALRGLGQVRSIQGQFEEAEELGQRIVTMAAMITPDTRTQAKALSFLGVVLMQRQNLADAESVLLQALEIVDRIAPQSPDAAGIRNNIAMVHYYRRDFARARYYYEQALTAAELTKPASAQVARTRYNIALTYANEGLHLQAAKQLEQVLAIQQQLVPNSEDVARTLHSLAMRFDEANDVTRARDYEVRALELYRRILPDSYLMATSVHKLGQIELRDNHPDQARPLLEEVILIARRDAFNTRLHAESAFDLGEVHHVTGNNDQALTYYREAVGVVESLQSRLGGGDEALSAFRDYYAHFFNRYVEVLLLEGQTAKAFEVSERYRAQVFLALLNSKPSALLEQIPEGVRFEYKEAQSAFEKAFDDARDNDPTSLQGLEQARLVWQEASDRLRVANAAGQILIPRYVDAKQAGSQLSDDTVIVSFIAGKETLNVLVMRRGYPPQHYRVDTPYKELVDMAGRIRVLIAAPDAGERSRAALETLLSQMGEVLLGPALGDLAPGTRLVLLPDRELWLLPFSALRLDDSYIVQQWPLQLSWSTTSYLAVDQSDSSAVEWVAFADPVSSPDSGNTVANSRDQLEHSLPGAMEEVEQISRQFDDKQIYFHAAATEAAFRKHAGNAAVVHVAAHAHTDVSPPLEAYLQLAPDANHDGRLMVWEVMSSLQLEAQLVVLSGCATAMGMEVSGEGLMGLTRAFGIAGARRILASQWPVMDKATAELMSDFYDARSSGLDDAKALQLAQNRFIGDSHNRKSSLSRLLQSIVGQRSPDLSHPFYWAAFSLYGAKP